jgi:hypothetical protein
VTDVTLKSDLTEAQAKTLTEKIRKSADAMWKSILYAYECRIWLAMGYPSWAEYLVAEFDMSRSRGYQLLDQANVTLALASAADVKPETIALSAREVQAIKPDLPVVVEKVREATKGQPKATRPKTVKDAAATEAKTAKVQHDGRATQGEQSKTLENRPQQVGQSLIAALTGENQRLRGELKATQLLNERLEAEVERLKAELAKRTGIVPKDGPVAKHTVTTPMRNPGKVSAEDAPKVEKALASHSATDCPHPKKEEKHLGWGVKCGLCNTVLR